MKNEFRKSTSILSDLNRWKITIDEGRKQVMDQIKVVAKSRNDSKALSNKVRENASQLAEKLNDETSSLRDAIFGLENCVQETEGLEIEKIAVADQTIGLLRSLKDSTRKVDNLTLDYLKLLSLSLNNGHRLNDELAASQKGLLSELRLIEDQVKVLFRHLRSIKDELDRVSKESKNLSSKNIL